MAYIMDVAREAGVSVATVSCVLSDAGRQVRAETRQRVLEVTERLRHSPNSLGRSLRLGRPTLGTTFSAHSAVRLPRLVRAWDDGRQYPE